MWFFWCVNSDGRYLTLKLRVCRRQNESNDDEEIAISRHLEQFSLDHSGRSMIRPVLGSFDIFGPKGRHKCLLYQPLGWSFAAFLDLLPDRRFPKDLVQQSTQLLLGALDYLHKCGVIHTGKPLGVYSLLDAKCTPDISPYNVLMRIKDESILPKFAQKEIEQPSARMVRPDRTIYIYG
jgi:serine/threonine-protein kinase SRPK3